MGAEQPRTSKRPHTAVLWGQTCCTHCPIAVQYCSARCLWLPTAQPSSRAGMLGRGGGLLLCQRNPQPPGCDDAELVAVPVRCLFVTCPHDRGLCIPNFVLWSFQPILSKIIGLPYGDWSPRHVHTQLPSVPRCPGRTALCP